MPECIIITGLKKYTSTVVRKNISSDFILDNEDTTVVESSRKANIELMLKLKNELIDNSLSCRNQYDNLIVRNIHAN